MSEQSAMDVFAEETYGLLEEIESELLELESDPSSASEETINAIFRAAHTIKGSAGMFGLELIDSYTHHVEAVFDALRSGDLLLDPALVDLLLKANDHNRKLVDCSVQASAQEVDPKDTENIVAELEAVLANKAGAGNVVPNTPDTTSELELQPEIETQSGSDEDRFWKVQAAFEGDIFIHGLDPISILRYLHKSTGAPASRMQFAQVPDMDELDPEQCYYTTLSVIPESTSRDEIEEAFEFVADDCELSIIPPHSAVSESLAVLNDIDVEDESRLGDLLVECGAISRSALDKALNNQDKMRDDNVDKPIGEVLVEEQNVNPEIVTAALEKQTEARNKKFVQTQFIKVDANKLDQLIDLVGEMVITGATSQLLAQNLGEESLLESMSQLESLMESVRDSTLQLRMVQIGETFKKFRRVVRDVSQELNKDVELVLEGGETELDKTFVEKLGDPLMHLIRNCLDHGLETRDERLQSDKPDVGTLKLTAGNDAGSVVIEISDDGKGLNTQKILDKAIENGLVTEKDKLTEQQIHNLIFEPGFSTAQEVTKLSGRGVGMDVVRKNVEALRGTVDVVSKAGEGSVFQIRLPLTLAIIDGFLFRAGQSKYVVPLDMVAECIDLDEVTEQRVRQERHIKLRDELLPCIDLRDLFPHIDPPDQNCRDRSIMVLRFGQMAAGVIVDQLLGELQTVIKPIGKLYENIRCVTGATIRGDGEIAIILDAPGLIKMGIEGGSLNESTDKIAEG